MHHSLPHCLLRRSDLSLHSLPPRPAFYQSSLPLALPFLPLHCLLLKSLALDRCPLPQPLLPLRLLPLPLRYPHCQPDPQRPRLHQAGVPRASGQPPAWH